MCGGERIGCEWVGTDLAEANQPVKVAAALPVLYEGCDRFVPLQPILRGPLRLGGEAVAKVAVGVHVRDHDTEKEGAQGPYRSPSEYLLECVRTPANFGLG